MYQYRTGIHALLIFELLTLLSGTYIPHIAAVIFKIIRTGIVGGSKDTDKIISALRPLLHLYRQYLKTGNSTEHPE